MAHFDDVIMPTSVRFGSISVPETDTQQVFKTSGFRKTNQRRSRQQVRLTLTYLKSGQGIHDILKIWRALKGPANTGLVLDHTDWNSTDGRMDTGDEILITAFDQPLKNTVTGLFAGDGSTTIYQLTKEYLVGASAAEVRYSTKPISGTVKIGVDGAELAAGGSPDDFTVDHSTGLVTFENPPGAGVSPTAVPTKCGYQYRIPFHFLEDRGFVQRLRTAKANELPGLELLEAFLS